MTEAIFLLVTSGDGPGECQQAVAMVLDQLTQEAEAEDIGIAIALNPGCYGPQSASVSLEGKGADGLAKSWHGAFAGLVKARCGQGTSGGTGSSVCSVCPVQNLSRD